MDNARSLTNRRNMLRPLCTFVCLCLAQGVAADVLLDCFASMHDELAATALCDTALASPLEDAQRSRAQAALAMVQARRGDLVQARINMNRALAAAPADQVVLANHGTLLLREQEYAAALAAYDDVSGRSATIPLERTSQMALYLNRSLALRALGRYDEAARDYLLYRQLAQPESAPRADAAPRVIPGTPAAPEY